MNFIDMIIIVLLIWAVYRGYSRGFIMQLTLFAALALGIFGALKLSGITARYLENRLTVGNEHLYLISIGITFLMVFIGVNILGKFIERLVESMELSSVNRMLGVFFGLCKMLLITGILLLYIDRLDRHVNLLPPHSREQSLFYKPFTSVVKTLFPSLKAPDSYDKNRTEFV